MGMIEGVLGFLFGNGRNVVKETVEVFRENANEADQRGTQVQIQAMEQHGAEFAVARQGGFDQFMDGVNRVPRPLLALGTIGLFVCAMVDPIWFAERMQGIALVPEPLWWLLGVIVSFYFGARHQVKTQQFQREIAATVTRAPQVMENIRQLREMRHDDPGTADTGADSGLQFAALIPDPNPALEAWRKKRA
ncbi:carboxylesterase [Aliishimia ponticola]|uniref:Carboxylesterase n=1 Tax=Aliishimia ponticola TaxID=2499833 RepID=A0A4S4NGT6_9RHOB|nr:holin family protein [Aliishimia ponticola]THH38862.1 carboxylesterase [Aliishimia ponticola]